jgi:anti-sigma factor ChrR (cupin superfamily)
MLIHLGAILTAAAKVRKTSAALDLSEERVDDELPPHRWAGRGRRSEPVRRDGDEVGSLETE